MSIKQKWIDALRSGNYSQSKHYLRRKDISGRSEGYCCLGVLCDIVDPEGWDVGTEFGFRHQGETDGPSESVKESVGLTDEQENALIGMNDREGLSFNEIADWIEANIGS